MTELTLENWRDKFVQTHTDSLTDWRTVQITKFISKLLALQKTAIKEEAVKRIEEKYLLSTIRTEEDEKVDEITFWDGLKKAQDIIRKL